MLSFCNDPLALPKLPNHKLTLNLSYEVLYLALSLELPKIVIPYKNSTYSFSAIFPMINLFRATCNLNGETATNIIEILRSAR